MPWSTSWTGSAAAAACCCSPTSNPRSTACSSGAGPLGALGPDRVFWGADQAIVAAGSPAAPIVLAPGLAVADPELDELPRGVVASD